MAVTEVGDHSAFAIDPAEGDIHGGHLRRTFVPAAQLLTMFASEKPHDSARFFADLDNVVDQGHLGE